ncbi:hypothetical protein G7B40_033350 [Aetokthonos hydrillicola Thurmond2011]|jgi:mRNA-degrading endonuclease RelE of RelBE toxin-antitoxin system|uniref:Uncharacterized protein n=1 Tax=Aetokthonos hydrillicola Thurmond2011 TaxID=2712845 RepID=A0AAP5ID68_9CYAN|nr:hypothetical protein [Aetokthonos hydrillicola]MBW4590301.1 hypothetical protein [Aetokthonos hydrillicola CCALA 1050]MDR9899411.1 hypothetical protein [Aetokthonos hydrillicola Thurmond2011]
MSYEIILSPEAVEDLRALRADVRQKVREAIETFLKYEPKKVSKSRIKRILLGFTTVQPNLLLTLTEPYW